MIGDRTLPWTTENVRVMSRIQSGHVHKVALSSANRVYNHARSAYRGTFQEFLYVTRFRFECSFRVIRLQTVQIHNISSSLSRFSVQVRLQRRLFSTIARYYIISVKSSQHKTYLKSLTKKSACEDMFSVKDLVVALSKLQSDAVNMYR